jgi:hypothetical protein
LNHRALILVRLSMILNDADRTPATGSTAVYSSARRARPADVALTGRAASAQVWRR